ncbi:MAG: transposase [Armatimonadetes bacterium]|nr:transposase [Armatimonadota bacterium]
MESPRGKQLYARRSGTIEPSFGNLKEHFGIDPVWVRGLVPMQSGSAPSS